ncbi:tyrosine-type recombinase/integrase [Hungatella hathewayi]
MENRIYLYDLYQAIEEADKKYVAKNPYYDLQLIPSPIMREEFAAFIKYRASQVGLSTLYGERKYYKKIGGFLQKRAKRISSFRDQNMEMWLRLVKGWMLEEGIALTCENCDVYGNITMVQSRLICYLKWVLEFIGQPDNLTEQEKDIWELDKLDIPIRENLIKNFKTINFTKIPQAKIRKELKRGIYLNLQGEAISCVQREMTAMRRFSKYLSENQREVQSCQDINREVIEEYLIYLKTEEITTKHLHAELNRLRSILESIGKICEYQNLEGLFLSRDIPPVPQAAFKAYSDCELKRLNASIVNLDEQLARAMIIHQMLGTRISDTLTLETDCLYEYRGESIIRIRQMKTKTYEKPVSEELASLIRKAIDYTRERYGETKYIFANDSNPARPLQYNTIQVKVVAMIRKENLRDDNGELFGFGSHMYRHYYGVKLTEMHLDDFTISKLLGHSGVRNVKYYRKMSNQILADETRKVRRMLSEIILQNLDGWEAEYEQIRKDAGLE